MLGPQHRGKKARESPGPSPRNSGSFGFSAFNDVNTRNLRLLDLCLAITIGFLLGVLFTKNMCLPPDATNPAPAPAAAAACPACPSCPSCPISDPTVGGGAGVTSSVGFSSLTQDELIASLSARSLGLEPKQVAQALTSHWWELPCQGDTDLMLHALKTVYRMSSRDPVSDNGVIVDVGANVGQTSAAILAMFGQIDFKLYVNEQGGDGVACGKAQEPIEARVFAMEPGREVGKKLVLQAKNRGWDKVGWKLIAAAASDADTTAHFADKGDEISSLQGEKGENTYEVKVSRVDTEFDKEMKKYSSKVFLLKLDCEGSDALAINGAEKLLQAKAVKFLLFEYNSLWFTQGPQLSLASTVEKLWSWGYTCFYITPKTLLPLSDMFWHDEYEIKKWSNIFCGVKGDNDLSIAIQSFLLAPWREAGQSHPHVDSYFFHCEGQECKHPK